MDQGATDMSLVSAELNDFQTFQQFVRTICLCLREKMPLMEKVRFSYVEYFNQQKKNRFYETFYATSDEKLIWQQPLPPDIAAEQVSLEKINQAYELVFQDDTIYNIFSILATFETFQKKYPVEYEKTYCTYALKQLILPFLQYGFCRMNRFVEHESSIAFTDAYPLQVKNHCIENAMIPHLTEQLSYIMDPSSCHHTSIASSWVTEYPILLDIVHDCFNTAPICLTLVDPKDEHAMEQSAQQFIVSTDRLRNCISVRLIEVMGHCKSSQNFPNIDHVITHPFLF